MIKATARPMISSVVHVVNEDTSGSPRSVPATVTTTHIIKAMIEATDTVVVKAIDKVVIEAFGKATIKDTDEDEMDTGIVKYTAQRQTTITTMSILYKNNLITFRLMLFFILTRVMNNLMIICMMNSAMLTCLIMRILMMCNLIICMMIMCRMIMCRMIMCRMIICTMNSAMLSCMMMIKNVMMLIVTM